MNLAYTGDTYGASLTYGSYEMGTNGVRTDDYLALNAYYTFDGGMSVSAGYEVGSADGLSDTTQWFVGLQWDEAGPGTFGAAVGTIGASAGNDASTTPAYDPELLMYEAFYSYEINDGMTITPLIYTKETGAFNEDKTGVMVKTSFSF